MNVYLAQYTDTWGPDRSANGSWLKEHEVVAKDIDQATRLAKKHFGIGRCTKENYGDSVVLFPRGECTRMDIKFVEKYEPLPEAMLKVIKEAEEFVNVAITYMPNSPGNVILLERLRKVIKQAEEE